jgi:DNA-binding response OmpR family regulator
MEPSIMTEILGQRPEVERRKLILVVDDEPSISQFLVRILEGAGFEAQGINDPGKACSLADQIRPDLIILDFDMPKLTGPELCAMLKTSTVCSRVPTIILSGMHDEDHRTIGSSGGAQAYLSKPVDKGELLGTIRRLL